MVTCLELHDSIVAACGIRGCDLVIYFSDAVLHRSSGRAGTDAGKVYALGVDLVLSNAQLIRPFVATPTSLLSGSLKIGDTTHQELAPYPLQEQGRVDLELVDALGNLIRIVAGGVVLIPTSKERYVEGFPE